MSEAKDFKTAKEFFKSLNIIYIALFVGQMMFFTTAYYLSQEEGALKPHEDSMLWYIAIGLACVCVVMGSMIYKAKIFNDLPKAVQLRDKLNTFRAASIVRLAIVEGAALFCAANLMTSGDLRFAYLFLALLVAFFFYRPTRWKLIHDLELDASEKEVIENNKPIAQ